MKRIITPAILIALVVLVIGGSFQALGQNSQPSARTPARTNASAAATRITLPMQKDSLYFAIIGDTGTGTNKQQQLADILLRYRQTVPFEFVLMMGDNLYGGEGAADYKEKFENIYQSLLNAGVKFYATLGNHDESNQRFYNHFNMDGKEYYGFKKKNAHFWSLNSNYMDAKQVKWLEDELSKSDSQWKICFFHHPPYSSGKAHGSDNQLREVVEPIFTKHGVNVVFTGHEHFYERTKPQKGIYYFISGAGGKLRSGDIRSSGLTEKGYDRDLSFMIIEIAGDQLHFQVISRTGETVDSGVIRNSREKMKASTP